MHPDLLKSACDLYHTNPDELIPLSGGYSNAVYQFPLGEALLGSGTLGAKYSRKYAILRLGVEDCPPDQTLGMLTWVDYLNQNGAPVTRPILSTNGYLLESLEFDGSRYTLTCFEGANGILAERLPASEWTDELFHRIGQAIGRFHRISSGYQPSHHKYSRPNWIESAEIRTALTRLDTMDRLGYKKLSCLLPKIQKLPISKDAYGLIHDDLHFANFLIQPDGNIMIIDFDDCLYGWFAMDIAMALFDVLVLYNAPTELERERFAAHFLSCYLAGYRSEKDISSYWLSQLPDFLKLKELCIYADLLGHPDCDHPGTWVGNFMHGRPARVANDIPYADLDFASL